MSRHLTLGVAGHIDHGKTALVRALTGIDTDRLPEERERGMSIVLGFAPLTLPDGSVVDLIDVPGHERFVGAMIAGASGIDALLLVISAAEQVKPQTAEHLALAQLLGVRRGLIAVTKSDLLDGDNSDAARSEAESSIRAHLAGTFLADASFIFTSAVTREGIDALRSEIERLLPAPDIVAATPFSAPFALPIDRVFVLPGHGAVVTGTLRGGPLHAGEPVEVFPAALKTEARALQIHGNAVATVHPGWRIAVNLRNIKKDQLRRGDLLAAPGSLRPTTLIDATLTLLPGATIKRGDQLRLHFAATETTARAYPLDSLIQNSEPPSATPKVPPIQGSWPKRPEGYIQLRLTHPIAVPAHTLYILRSLSPAATLGGGRFLDLHPLRKAGLAPDAHLLLDALAGDDPAAKLALKLQEFGAQGASLPHLAADLGINLAGISEPSPDVVLAAHNHALAVHRHPLEALQHLLLQAAELFHQENSRIEQGAPLAALQRRLPPGYARPEIVDTALALLAAQGELILAPGGRARLSTFIPQPLTPDEIRVLEIFLNTYRRARLQPPDADTLANSDPVRRDLLHLLARSGQLNPIPDRATGRTFLFHPAVLADLDGRLAAWAPSQTGFTVSDFTQAFQTTRKFAIPLLEYLDTQGKTCRVDDRRYWQSRNPSFTPVGAPPSL